MASRPTLLIVGGGLAGAKAAEAARAGSYEGRVVLVGEEARPPYERPPLSKEILRGAKPLDSSRVREAASYAELDIELMTGTTVAALDLQGRRANLSSGDSIAFDTVILATGAAPRPLPFAGAQLSGVHYLRTVEDSASLHDAITQASRVAVIGAGWIGSEVAASARQMGAEVVLIEPEPYPLGRVLGDEVGQVFATLHADQGVTLRLGIGVTELRGSGSVEQVVLADGSVEAADVVVAGIGVAPRVDLATSAGIKVDNGVVVDDLLRSSAPGVYAAGDIASAWHPHYKRHLRVEHWANALNQGTAAGANASGAAQSYTRLPYFYSDQYDLGLEYVGYADADDQVVIRGDTGKREFIAFYHRGGVVNAALAVNVWDVIEDLRTLITDARPLDLARMADPEVALTDL